MNSNPWWWTGFFVEGLPDDGLVTRTHVASGNIPEIDVEVQYSLCDLVPPGVRAERPVARGPGGTSQLQNLEAEFSEHSDGSGFTAAELLC